MNNLSADKDSIRIKLRLLTGVSIASLALTACGQKGNLYLPNQGATIQDSSQKSHNRSKEGHEQDEFIIPQGLSHTQQDKQIQQQIEEMQANPNDF